jgi:hypothetical protein
MSKNGNGKNSNGKKEKNGKFEPSNHHIIPRSREGSDHPKNILKIPRMYHELLHQFFGNLTPDEMIEFIEIVFKGKGRKRRKRNWKWDEIYALQLVIQQNTIKEKNKKQRVD